MSDIDGVQGIVGVCVQNGNALFAPLPDMPNLYHRLVACGSRILLAGFLFENHRRILKEVIIWELLKVNVDSCYHFNVSWSDIARMPRLMCEEVGRIWHSNKWFEFMGVGDWV